MKKFYQILLGVTLLIIGSTGLSQAQETKMMAANTAAVEKVANPNFKFAENLVISEDLNGDVYAAGGTVRIDGNINGDLIVAGGQVYINGNISQDLRVFGGTVTINGIVEQNASIFAGEVELGPNSEINGSVVGGAGNGNFSGSIMGGTWFGAGNTSLAGKHGDQVNLWTESAQLLSNSEINGDLNIEMDKAGEIDDQNPQISGQKNIKVAETSKQINQQKGQFSKITKGANGAGQVIKFLMSLVSGLLIIYLFPKISKLAEAALKEPAKKMGIGFLLLVLAPIAIILIAITIFALPLAGLALMSYLAALRVAQWVGALALGQWLHKKYKWSFLKKSWAQFATALTAVSLINIVPVLGGTFKFLVMLMGLGAISNWLKSLLRKS